jgi:hypothetical protein
MSLLVWVFRNGRNVKGHGRMKWIVGLASLRFLPPRVAHTIKLAPMNEF